MSVLIVEDDTGVQESIAELLRGEGYDVQLAGDGKRALELLHAGKVPSLILLDLMMPGMDGIEFRAHQLEDPALAKIPVILMSARPDVKQQARRLQAVDFLVKPMSFEELIHVVQNRAVTQEIPPVFSGRTLRDAWSDLNTPTRSSRIPPLASS